MKILVANFGEVRAWTITEADVARLRTLAPHATVVHAQTTADILDAIGDTDAAFSWRIDAAALARAGRLRWVHSPAAGIGAALLSDELRRRPIVLTNSRGINGVSVAEHAFALILALTRDIHLAVARQAGRQWAQNELTDRPPHLLEGRTLGIVGLGRIGEALVRIARGFGMRVLATRRRAELGAPEGVDELLPAHDLPRLLAASDVIVLAAPQTRDTTRLIGPAELAAMKRQAILINVGRGGLVHEPALVAALQTGALAGAGLDVFEDEPLPASSPLWSLPNVILTPHVAGLRADYWRISVDLFADNLKRFEAGEPLMNVVDKEAGY